MKNLQEKRCFTENDHTSMFHCYLDLSKYTLIVNRSNFTLAFYLFRYANILLTMISLFPLT